ncbi:MAG: hypothetical protein N4A57_07490 [Anaeromicrobium sp.]|jgi:hypothetical protein|uniref:hypothetical protein n=1 Tax=Anaeromicrobium sp. TaxID=1929132 RepID=UPI0025E0B1FD|nr:hypothetical protein [Anaeromicrobium sp.]MCT4594093.1 hypothetical protein [Anaeromicrobium sp.]
MHVYAFSDSLFVFNYFKFSADILLILLGTGIIISIYAAIIGGINQLKSGDWKKLGKAKLVYL